MVKIKRRDTLLRVLTTIANAGVAFGRHPARHALSVYRAARDFEELQEATDRELRRVSEYIVRKKYVTLQRDESGHASLVLSHQGKKVVGMHALRELRPLRQKVWGPEVADRSFDIPNHAKSARDSFAGTLKRAGLPRTAKVRFREPLPVRRGAGGRSRFLRRRRVRRDHHRREVYAGERIQKTLQGMMIMTISA